MTNQITTTNTGRIQGGRRLPSQQDLNTLVAQGAELAIADGKSFTAYSVTLALQANNPGLEIRHEDYAHLIGVRDTFFAYMENNHPQMVRNSTGEYWSGVIARTYHPPAKVVVTKPASAQITKSGADAGAVVKAIASGSDGDTDNNTKGRKPLKRASNVQTAIIVDNDDDEGDTIIPVNTNSKLAGDKDINPLGIPMLTNESDDE